MYEIELPAVPPNVTLITMIIISMYRKKDYFKCDFKNTWEQWERRIQTMNLNLIIIPI